MTVRSLVAAAWIGLLLVAGSTVAIPAAAAGPGAADEARVQRLKADQQRRLMQGARARLARYQARLRPGAAGSFPGVRRRPPPDASEAGGPQGADRFARPMAAAVEGPASPHTNVLVNNRATDTATCPVAPCTGQPWSGQSEVSIAAFGTNLVAAWNDGEGFVTGGSTQGWGYSTDGGMTWIDGGAPPPSGAVGVWTSDPVIAVNEKTGAFYFAALCEPTLSTNGIAVVKGTFGGGGFTWGTPRVVVSGSNGSVIYDKEWLAADSTTGNLYLIYSRFTVTGGTIFTNRIDFQRSVDDNLSPWSLAATVSSGADAGRAQGARVVVGPTGDVWATWNAIGETALDYMRIRRSTDQGTSWGAQVTAVSQYTNFGSGAPGFNRGLGFAFPGVTVDRTNGPHRGRAYLVWNESLDFYNDPIGTGGTIGESEPNHTADTADPFTPGQALTGTISSSTDFDYWSFDGAQGQTLICELDASSAPSLAASFRLFCSNGTTRLAFSETFPGGLGLIVFTLPAAGTYTLRVAPFSGTGPYTIRTGWNGPIAERARDHRDVFVSFSDDGIAWGTPARVNDDPGHFDDWLPEIAVAELGRPYVAWYDWRDAPPAACGGVSHVYLSRSDDGGVSWTSLAAVSDVQTAWTSVLSNIAPNQGDYIALFGNTISLYPAWTDGRFGDPDIFTAPIPLVVTPVLATLTSTFVEPGLVRLVWHAPDAGGLTATLYRRADDGEWVARGRVWPDGSRRLVFEDREVVPGSRYHYRLGLPDGAGESFTGEVTVEVPVVGRLRLAIRDVRPNPADREMWVEFSLAGTEPATIELLDVSGRRVREWVVAGAGSQMLDLAAGTRLAPGVYLVRLTQAGRSVVTRVSVLR